MKKKWRNIIIISLILVMVEMTATVIFLHPYYKTQMVFNSISEGNWIETKDNYDKLSSAKQDRVQKYLSGYANWIKNQYAAGEITYDKAAASFDAINSIDESGTLYSTYMTEINKNEYVKTILGMHAAEVAYDNAKLYEYKNTLNSVSQRLDSDSRETLMVNMLNMQYDKFLNEEITVDSMKRFCDVIVVNSYYAAYDYSFVIAQNVDYVVNYRSVYENAVVKFDEKDYFAVMDMCSEFEIDPDDTLYQTRIKELYTNAYEAGKEYYKNQLDSYIAADDKDSAVSLMTDIQKRYGDDFDLSDVKEDMAEDWQKAAIAYMDNWESNLKSSLGEFTTGEYILENEYNSLRPDSILLYDIDGNDIPEIFLFNSARAQNEYVECFIYAYVEGEYVFKKYLNVMNFCYDSNIVAFPVAFDRNTGDECVLYSFDGYSFTEGNECQAFGSEYYVNGVGTTDAEFLSAQSAVLSHINEKTVGNSVYSSLDDSEGYILAY